VVAGAAHRESNNDRGIFFLKESGRFFKKKLRKKLL
jgi:hypothetical protein